MPNTPDGGGRPRLPTHLRWKRGTLDGEEVVYIALGKDPRKIILPLEIADRYLALGYPYGVCLRDNGSGRRYLSHDFRTPGVTETGPRDFARTIFAINLVAEEMSGGPKADLRGKEVKLLNVTDRYFDLRPEFMVAVPGRPRDGGWQAVADVRKRWPIRFPPDGSEGQNPNSYFASVNRSQKALKRQAKKGAGGAVPEGGLVEHVKEELA